MILQAKNVGDVDMPVRPTKKTIDERLNSKYRFFMLKCEHCRALNNPKAESCWKCGKSLRLIDNEETS